MSDERRRRRRPGSSSARRSSNSNGFTPWLITIAAALAVIAGGWFLGQALAHAFGGRSENQTAQTLPNGVPLVTPLPSASQPPATPEPSPSSSPEPLAAAPTPQPSPTQPVTPAPSPTAAPLTPAPTASAAATATPAPLPSLEPTRRIRTPAPTVIPSREPSMSPPPEAVVASGSVAVQTVRAYIAALMRGDPQTAAGYLGNGSPDESFINSQTRIDSIGETRNADGSSNVDVVMQTSQGRYHETFEVAAGTGGTRILGKSASKT